MARTLSSTLADLESAIADEGNAWAASQGHAQNAHLAAWSRRVFSLPDVIMWIREMGHQTSQGHDVINVTFGIKSTQREATHSCQ